MSVNRLFDQINNVVMNYSPIEVRVRDATNDETWGPHGAMLAELSKFTYTYEYFPEVIGMLWRRMFEAKRNWRRTYKSLLVLHYLVRNGSERVVNSVREHYYDLEPLETYELIDEKGKDQGINVRQKSKEIRDLIMDDDMLREERKKARATKDKFVGMSGDELQTPHLYNEDPKYKYKKDTQSNPKPQYQDRDKKEKPSFRVYRDDTSNTSNNDVDVSYPSDNIESTETDTTAVTEDKPTLLAISQKPANQDTDDNNNNLFGEFKSATNEPVLVKPPPSSTTVSKSAENNLLGDLTDLNLTSPVSTMSTGVDDFDIFKSATTTTQAPMKPNTTHNIDLNSLLQSSPSNTVPIQSVPYTVPPANQSYYYPPGTVYIPNQQVSYPGYQPQYMPVASNPYQAQNTRYIPPPQQQANTAFLPPPMQPTKFPANTFQSNNSQQTGSSKISNGNVPVKKSRDPLGDLDVFGQK
ncbi:hypothetical protein LOD99_2284 [Oopsacas minuta]|uniref:ENTH domain-containing protein n=1 Tax=Oopsacas minuta TaxID=111878 RepID=A0AAV7K2I7_9METZ|nr:hypothetical protein LOD99_2284 [Oopsacas minuta]